MGTCTGKSGLRREGLGKRLSAKTFPFPFVVEAVVDPSSSVTGKYSSRSSRRTLSLSRDFAARRALLFCGELVGVVRGLPLSRRWKRFRVASGTRSCPCPGSFASFACDVFCCSPSCDLCCSREDGLDRRDAFPSSSRDSRRSWTDTGTGGLENVVAKLEVLRFNELMIGESVPD